MGASMINRTPGPLTPTQLEAALAAQVAINHKLHDNLEIAETEIARLKREVNNRYRDTYTGLEEIWSLPYPDAEPGAQSTARAAANR